MDIQNLIEKDKEFREIVDEINLRWQWEFRTPENIEKMNQEIRESFCAYIENKREEKINQILNDPLHRK